MNVLDVFDALNKLSPEDRKMVLDRFTVKAEVKRKGGRPKKVVVPAPIVTQEQVQS